MDHVIMLAKILVEIRLVLDRWERKVGQEMTLGALLKASETRKSELEDLAVRVTETRGADYVDTMVEDIIGTPLKKAYFVDGRRIMAFSTGKIVYASEY